MLLSLPHTRPTSTVSHTISISCTRPSIKSPLLLIPSLSFPPLFSLSSSLPFLHPSLYLLSFSRCPRFMIASLITKEMLSKSNTFADQFCKWASDTVRSAALSLLHTLFSLIIQSYPFYDVSRPLNDDWFFLFIYIFIYFLPLHLFFPPLSILPVCLSLLP